MLIMYYTGVQLIQNNDREGNLTLLGDRYITVFFDIKIKKQVRIQFISFLRNIKYKRYQEEISIES